MATDKRDLLIHYDEEGQKLIFYSTPTGGTTDVRAKEFGGVCPEVEYFQGMPPEEAEMKLGGLVFSLLDLGSERKIGIREYAAEAEATHALFVEELEEQIKANDADAQYQLFIHLKNSSMKNCSLAELARAESLLLASAAQGHDEAKRSLESWPDLKAVFERRINRGRAA